MLEREDISGLSQAKPCKLKHQTSRQNVFIGTMVTGLCLDALPHFDWLGGLRYKRQVHDWCYNPG